MTRGSALQIADAVKTGTHVNPALVEMLGYRYAADLKEMGPRDLFADDALRGRFTADVARTPTFRQIETQWLRRDGTRITVELTGRVRTDPEGGRIYEVHAQDVTEQRRFERELHQTQKMEAVGRLAGGVARDFNNLLTVISGNLMLVLEEPGLLPGFKSELMDAHNAAERGGALTSSLCSRLLRVAASRSPPPLPRAGKGRGTVPPSRNSCVPRIRIRIREAAASAVGRERPARGKINAFPQPPWGIAWSRVARREQRGWRYARSVATAVCRTATVRRW